jgi:hypothetical protein
MARLPISTPSNSLINDYAFKNIFPEQAVPIVAASYGLKPNDSTILLDVSINPITVQLTPQMSFNSVNIKVIGGNLAANNVTIIAPAGFTINGGTSITLQDPGESIRVYKPNNINDFKIEYYYENINSYLPTNYQWTNNGELAVTNVDGSINTFNTPYFIDGVIDGFTLTQEPSPTANIFNLSGGVAQINAQLVSNVGGIFSIATNPSLTNSRIDLIVIDINGDISVIQGTLSPNPVPPNVPPFSLVLYEIGVSTQADGTDPSKFTFAAANIIGSGGTVSLPNGVYTGQILVWNNTLKQWRTLNGLVFSNNLITNMSGNLTLAATTALILQGNGLNGNFVGNVLITTTNTITFDAVRTSISGSFNIGDSTTPPIAGDLRYLGGSFAGYNGNSWIEFGTAPVIQVVASSANTLTANFNLGDIVRVTMTENITTLNLSNAAEGVIYILELIQGGSGSYTITWPSSVDFGNYGAPILSTIVGRKDLIYLYRSNGKYLASYAIGYNNS